MDTSGEAEAIAASSSSSSLSSASEVEADGAEAVPTPPEPAPSPPESAPTPAESATPDSVPNQAAGHGHSHVHRHHFVASGRPAYRFHFHPHPAAHLGHGHSHNSSNSNSNHNHHNHHHHHNHHAPDPGLARMHSAPPAGIQNTPVGAQGAANRPPPAPAAPLPQQQQHPQQSNQLGVVRDRLFHAMMVRMALSYSSRVSRSWRRIIEFTMLMIALLSFASLIFVHFLVARSATTCLDHVLYTWPRDGVLRVEVVRNLDVLEMREEFLRKKRDTLAGQDACYFDVKNVLLFGPQAIPAEIRQHEPRIGENSKAARSLSGEETTEEGAADEGKPASSVWTFISELLFTELMDDYDEDQEEELVSSVGSHEDMDMLQWEREFNGMFKPESLPVYEYRVEYSLIYGTLRLPYTYRAKHNITMMHTRIDSNDVCFGTPLARSLMQSTVGFEEAIMASLRALSVNESDIGYVHDLRTNEHYHFVQLANSKLNYLTAGLVMLLFTFAISLLLRFSHHQIFLFIVDLLHMFEHNQPLVFPAAPLLTVILALVGMEAIMSEVFSDTTTAFYVILIVWVADQFDAICCQSSTSKRHWLRFFFLYQYFFYAYQYRFGGLYGGLALFTSSAFILHSMIFFFHHYEIPLILYTDRLQRIMTEVNHPGTVIQEVDVRSATRAAEEAARRAAVNLTGAEGNMEREADAAGQGPFAFARHTLRPRISVALRATLAPTQQPRIESPGRIFNRIVRLWRRAESPPVNADGTLAAPADNHDRPRSPIPPGTPTETAEHTVERANSVESARDPEESARDVLDSARDVLDSVRDPEADHGSTVDRTDGMDSPTHQNNEESHPQEDVEVLTSGDRIENSPSPDLSSAV